MASHEQSEKKSLISRRGLLCGAVGASVALLGGELLASDGSDKKQPKPPVETNAPKLDLDWAYEIYGQARDMFRQCIERRPCLRVRYRRYCHRPRRYLSLETEVGVVL